MGRPPLAIGTAGEVGYLELAPRKIRARVQYRDLDGVVRPVARLGTSKADAKRNLDLAIRDRQRIAGDAAVTSTMTVEKLAGLWLTVVDASDKAVGTKQQYRKITAGYIVPELGSVRVGEATVPVCDRALSRINTRHGVAVAKSAKTVLSVMLGYAVRHGALTTNPVRDTERLAGATRPKRGKPKALTPDQTTELTDRLRTIQLAVDLDLPDLVDHVLGTGCRIGEALACRYGVNDDGQPLLDLEVGTWEVNATVIRVGGIRRLRALEEAKTGLSWEEQEELRALRTLAPGLHIQPRTKSDAGWRILALPPYLVDMHRRRQGEERFNGPNGVVFASPHGPRLRDRDNTISDLRTIRRVLGPEWEWVTFHTFRKTVATRMKEAGCTDIEVADQLGHADPSMTRNVYMGRNVTSARAAEVLDRR